MEAAEWLEPWEGPFGNPYARLPQHPQVTRERAAARQRSRGREREAAQLVPERDCKKKNVDAGDAELLEIMVHTVSTVGRDKYSSWPIATNLERPLG
jgi:hypothetical protein